MYGLLPTDNITSSTTYYPALESRFRGLQYGQRHTMGSYLLQGRNNHIRWQVGLPVRQRQDAGPGYCLHQGQREGDNEALHLARYRSQQDRADRLRRYNHPTVRWL